MTTDRPQDEEPVGPVPVGKLTGPVMREVAKTSAEQVGACIRPLAVRRTDRESGATTVVPIPCGATRASVCGPCADRARRLRLWQAREGWHLDEEPETPTQEPTVRQRALLGQRADLEHDHAYALEAGEMARVLEIEAAIDETDALLRAEGVRGSTAKRGESPPKRRTRSTRRRQDVPDLPRLPVRATTTGRVFEAPDGKTYRPSTFVTLTLPSYGPVRADGAPRDPQRYDYRRAARDAIHLGELFDRFIQNLRRAVGWNVQYFAAVEPQRRGAPHLHAAIRGTIPRKLIRQVVAATYHQVWWPAHDQPVYTEDHAPVWDETRHPACYVDPGTGTPLASWEQALDALDDDPNAVPAHVIEFGTQVDIQGVISGTDKSDKAIRYLTKYLTKSIGETAEPDTPAAAAHMDRLVEALRWEPCSESCPNWLLHGIAPENPKPGMVPGQCRAKAHKRETPRLRRPPLSRLTEVVRQDPHRAPRRTPLPRPAGPRRRWGHRRARHRQRRPRPLRLAAHRAPRPGPTRPPPAAPAVHRPTTAVARAVRPGQDRHQLGNS